MGYIGQRMSERAAEAYEYGEKPLSKWTKSDILQEISDSLVDESLLPYFSKLSLHTLKTFYLKQSSWHHTGKYFQETSFYSLNYSAVERADVEELTSLIELDKEHKERRKKEKSEDVNMYITALVGYVYWTGTRKHPKPVDMEEVVYYRSKDKLVHTSCGTKRLSSLRIYESVEQKTKYAQAKRVQK